MPCAGLPALCEGLLHAGASEGRARACAFGRTCEELWNMPRPSGGSWPKILEACPRPALAPMLPFTLPTHQKAPCWEVLCLPASSGNPVWLKNPEMIMSSFPLNKTSGAEGQAVLLESHLIILIRTMNSMARHFHIF